jgi:hypothetical protein
MPAGRAARPRAGNYANWHEWMVTPGY